MKPLITHQDKNIVLQQAITYHFHIEVRNNDNQVMGTLKKIKPLGSLSIDADSDIRRTFSLTIALAEDEQAAETLLQNYMKYRFYIQIGLYSYETNSYHYYPLGDFIITDAGTAYHATDHSITFQLSDRMAELNGTVNGQLFGAQETIFKVPEPEETDSPSIKTLIHAFLKKHSRIKALLISDIGQFDGLEAYNKDYNAYRMENPHWDKLPYDLSFDAGSTILDMLITFRDLYPNYQVYMDCGGTLCFDMIPSCENNMAVLDNDFFQQVLISEQVSYDRSAIRNVTEVFGRCYEIDRYTEHSEWVPDSSILQLNFTDDTTIKNTIQLFAFQIAAEDEAAREEPVRIRILDGEYSLFHEYNHAVVRKSEIKSGQLYALRYENKNGAEYFYFLGESTPHAVCVLSEQDTYENKDVTAYIKDFFNCENVFVKKVASSPFSIQRLGLLTEVKQSGEFDNIYSGAAALISAKYYNDKSTMMCDTVTLTTKLIPFLDVQQKVTYKKQQEPPEAEPQPYVIKSVSHDFSSGTSTVTMYRFYPLYHN